MLSLSSSSSSSLLRPSSSSGTISFRRKVSCCCVAPLQNLDNDATKLDSISKSGGMRKQRELENDPDVLLIECRDVYKSFGEKHILKRVSFKVLLYDEPTVGLDPFASTVVEDLIRSVHMTDADAIGKPGKPGCNIAPFKDL